MSDIPSNRTWQRYNSRIKWREALPIAVIVLTSVESIIDCTTPRRLSDWLFFIVPILLTSWLPKRWTIYVTIVASVFTVIGFFLPIEAPPKEAWLIIFSITNRAIGITVFWITAVLINLRRKALEDLQHANAKLEEKTRILIEAERLKTEFLADTSHELRAPLAIVKSHLDLALGKKSKKVTDPYKSLRGIDVEVKHIAGIITNLILLVRAASGQERMLVKSTVNLKSLSTQVVKKHISLAENKGIVIKNMVPDILYEGDEDKLTMLFTNLLVNAIQYGKKGGHVDMLGETEPGLITIEFRDDGIGIPEMDIPHIFERFYRVEKARTYGGGVGLGLAICKWIVEAHEGSISVSSSPSVGSIFKIQFPVL